MAEQGWSFSAAPAIIDLAKSLAADPEALAQLSMDRTTASYKMKHGLAASFEARTVNIIKEQKFSLNIDEATSSSTTARVLTILVNFIDPAIKKLTTQHLTSLQLIRADSNSVFEAVNNFFTDHEIPWRNCMSVLLDSCAVMRGAKQGLEVRIRERAPHLLDIDGDVCHHVHNAAKKFCAPFKNWAEGLFMDVHNEFHWSSVNQDTLKEICFILDMKYSTPQNFVAHRWLSCHDAAQQTVLQLKPLTLYAFAFLSKEDKALYRPIVDSICKDISAVGRRRISQVQAEASSKNRTDDGRKRMQRMADKLFTHRVWTKLVLGIYSAVLAVMKEYVCLFQRDECSVHLLHDHQMTLFKRFLAMFVKPEAFQHLNPKKLTSQEHLSLGTTDSLQELQDMHVGSFTQRELGGPHARGKLCMSFLETAQAAFISCGKYLQQKLPLNNPVLKAMSALDPACEHDNSAVQKSLKRLPSLVSNVLTLSPQEVEDCADDDEKQAKLDKLTDEFNSEVDQFCTSKSLPSWEKEGQSVAVDEWWAAVNSKNQYSHLYSMASALLTCFHGPKVESSFSQMGDILKTKSNRMKISTFSAVQTVKYGLKGSDKSAVQCFARKEKLYTPVNHHLCRLMRGSHKKHVDEQKKVREEQEQKRASLSLKRQEQISKKQVRERVAEIEKQARLTHRRMMLARLNELSTKRKAASDSYTRPAKKSRV